MMDFVRVQTRP